MLAVPANRVSRPVSVLLGGSGRARRPTLRLPIVPALLKPAEQDVRRSACQPTG